MNTILKGLGSLCCVVAVSSRGVANVTRYILAFAALLLCGGVWADTDELGLTPSMWYTFNENDTTIRNHGSFTTSDNKDVSSGEFVQVEGDNYAWKMGSSVIELGGPNSGNVRPVTYLARINLDGRTYDNAVIWGTNGRAYNGIALVVNGNATDGYTVKVHRHSNSNVGDAKISYTVPAEKQTGYHTYTVTVANATPSTFLYVDGISVGSSDENWSMTQNGMTNLGQGGNGYSRAATGLLYDDFRFYTQVLTPAQVATIEGVPYAMYYNQLAGSELIPTGTYGDISIEESTGGYKATAYASNTAISGGTGALTDTIKKTGWTYCQTHTVCGWFNVGDLPTSGYKTIYAAKTDNGGYCGYQIAVDQNGKIVVGRINYNNGASFTDNNNKCVTDDNVVSANTWFHLAVAINRPGTAPTDAGVNLTPDIFVNGAKKTTSGEMITNYNGNGFQTAYLGHVSVGGFYVDATAISSADVVKKIATDSTYVREVNSAYKATLTETTSFSDIVWNNEGSPTSADDVEITVNREATLTIGSSVSCETLTILGSADLTIPDPQNLTYKKLNLTRYTGKLIIDYTTSTVIDNNIGNNTTDFVMGNVHGGTIVLKGSSILGLTKVNDNPIALDGTTLRIEGGFVKVNSKDVGGNLKNATIELAGGRIYNYGWFESSGTMTLDATTDTSIFCKYCSGRPAIVKKGTAKVSFEAGNTDGDFTSVRAEAGTIAFSGNAVSIGTAVAGSGTIEIPNSKTLRVGSLSGTGDVNVSGAGTGKLVIQNNSEFTGSLNLSGNLSLDLGTMSPGFGIVKSGEGTLELVGETRPKIDGMTGGVIKVYATFSELSAGRIALATTMTEIPQALSFSVINLAGESVDLTESPYSISEGNLVIDLDVSTAVTTSGNSSALFEGHSGNVPVEGGATAETAIAINFDSLPEAVTAITVNGFVKVSGNAFPSGDNKIQFAEGGTLIFDGTDTAQDVTTHLWVGENGNVITKGSVTFAKLTFEENTTFDIQSGTTVVNASKKHDENYEDRGLNGLITVQNNAVLDLNCGDAINYSANVTVKVYGTLDLDTHRQSINGGTKLFVLNSGTITGAGDGRGALHFFDSNRLVVSGTKTIPAAIQMRDASHELTIAQFRSSNVTFSGVFNGNGKLTRAGATSAEGNSDGNCGNSYVYLSGANTFAGALTNNGGFMVLLPGVAFSATTAITSGSGTELDFGKTDARDAITLANDITVTGNAIKIFADTTLSGTVSSSNGYAIQANGGNLHWAGTFTGAVANAGKMTIPQDVTFDTANNTLSGSGKIGGAGTLKSTTIPTVSVDTDWTGVVELAAIDYGSTKTGYNLSGLVRDGSTLKLHGIIGNDIYFTNTNKVNGVVELVDGAVFRICNGTSGETYEFAEIAGSGTFKTDMTGPSNVKIKINKLSSKNVTLTNSSKSTITIDNLVVVETYGTALVPVTECSAVTVTAVNGVAKETMQTEDGIYLVAAKNGETKYKTVQGAIDDAPGGDISGIVVLNNAAVPSGYIMTVDNHLRVGGAQEIYYISGSFYGEAATFQDSNGDAIKYAVGDTIIIDSHATDIDENHYSNEAYFKAASLYKKFKIAKDYAIHAGEGADTIGSGVEFTIESDCTLTVSEAWSHAFTVGSAMFKGSGTVKFEGKIPTDNATKNSFKSNDWTGTVWFKGVTFTGVNLNDYGQHANDAALSKIKLTDVDGYLARDSQVQVDIVLDDGDSSDPAFHITGTSHSGYIFHKKFIGTGTFKIEGGSGDQGSWFRVYDVSEFTGTIETNRPLKLGNDNLEASQQSYITVGSENSHSVTVVGEGKHWTADAITILGGAQVKVLGAINGPVTVNGGGLIGGSGSVNGAMTFNDASIYEANYGALSATSAALNQSWTIKVKNVTAGGVKILDLTTVPTQTFGRILVNGCTDADTGYMYLIVGEVWVAKSTDAPVVEEGEEIEFKFIPVAGITIPPGADVKVPTGADTSKIAVKYAIPGTETVKDLKGDGLVTVTVNQETGAIELTTTDSAKPATTAIAMATPTEESTDKVQFTITNPIPGLFYAVSSCDTPNGDFVSATGDQATSDAAKTVSIPMEFANGKKVKYYKVSVKATK